MDKRIIGDVLCVLLHKFTYKYQSYTVVTSIEGKVEYQIVEEVMYGWPLICSNPLFLAEVTAAMSPSVGGRPSVGSPCRTGSECGPINRLTTQLAKRISQLLLLLLLLDNFQHRVQ